MKISRYIPLLQWLPGYGKRELGGDLSAGLTVGVMLIPQGMAYGMLAGLPAIYGLYAAIVPLLIYAVFGTSRQLAVGPVAMVAILIASGVGKLAEPASAEYISLVILLAFMVGAMQLVLGAFRLGFLVNFLSHPVISGFTSAAAVIILFSQLKYLLGIEIERTHYIHEIVIQSVNKASDIHLPTLGLGLAAMGVILFFRKKIKRIPGPLVAVVAGILVVWLFRLDLQGMKIIGVVPDGFPDFAFPEVSGERLSLLFPVALTIALVGFMESMMVAKAIQARHKDYEVDANQELIGLGLANFFGSWFQSFPVTGGFARSAVNDQTGAKTGMASIISAVLVVLTLLFLTPLFYFLPKAILASIIMVAVVRLIDIKEAIHLWKADRRDFFMLLATFLATLSLGIEMGIAVGVLLSLMMIIYRVSYPHYAELAFIPGTRHYRNMKRFPQAIRPEGVLIVRFDSQLFFANTSYVKDKLQMLESQRKEPIRAVILAAQPVNGVDSSAVHMLKDIVKDYKARDIRFMVSGAIGPVRDIMAKSGLMDDIGQDNFFLHVWGAMQSLKEGDEARKVKKGIAVQSNVDNPPPQP